MVATVAPVAKISPDLARFCKIQCSDPMVAVLFVHHLDFTNECAYSYKQFRLKASLRSHAKFLHIQILERDFVHTRLDWPTVLHQSPRFIAPVSPLPPAIPGSTLAPPSPDASLLSAGPFDASPYSHHALTNSAASSRNAHGFSICHWLIGERVEQSEWLV